jgi:hypothetical protein
MQLRLVSLEAHDHAVARAVDQPEVRTRREAGVEVVDFNEFTVRLDQPAKERHGFCGFAMSRRLHPMAQRTSTRRRGQHRTQRRHQPPARLFILRNTHVPRAACVMLQRRQILAIDRRHAAGQTVGLEFAPAAHLANLIYQRP